MAIYASVTELEQYVVDDDAVILPGDDDARERLLQRAERAVDLAVGPWPVLSTGRKFDPALLDVTARAALSRATCAACEHEILVGIETLAGDSDFAPASVQVMTRAALVSPRMLRELAGSGLIKTSGTVVPELKPTWLGWQWP